MSEEVVVTSGEPKRRRSAVPILIAVVLVAFGACYVVIRKAYPHIFADPKTYDIYWHVPSPWKEAPKSAATLFLYKHPSHEVYIRGFQFHCDEEYNVTPDMDADALAKYYLTTTEENQLDWKGKRIADIEAGDLRFSVIERSRKGKVVFTAFTTKGNTTFGAALYGGEGEVGFATSQVPFFRKFLQSVELKPAMSRAKGTELPALKTTAENM